MITSAGALSAVPTTRSPLRAVGTHTVIAFNSIVIAMTVSLISSFVTTLDTTQEPHNDP
jgi:hypothetical protein